MSSESKKKLRLLIALLPLDSVQRKNAEEGVNKLTDKGARNLCERMSLVPEELSEAIQKRNDAIIQLMSQLLEKISESLQKLNDTLNKKIIDAIEEELRADEEEFDRLAAERMTDEGG